MDRDVVDELFYISYDDISEQDFESITIALQNIGSGTPEEITEPKNDVEKLLDGMRSAEGEGNLVRYDTLEGEFYALEGQNGFFLHGDESVLREAVPGIDHWADQIIDDEYDPEPEDY